MDKRRRSPSRAQIPLRVPDRRTRPRRLLLCVFAVLYIAISKSPPALAQIESPSSSPHATIEIRADAASHWRQGEYDVWHLRGSCQVRQGQTFARGQEALLWVDHAEPSSGHMHKVICYLEGGYPNGKVQVDFGHHGTPHPLTGRSANSIVDRSWFGRFHSTLGVRVDVPTVGGPPTVKPAILDRALAARNPAPRVHQPVRRTQFTTPEVVPAPNPSSLGGARRITITPRSSVPVQAKSFTDAARNEQILVINQGVRVVVEGVSLERFGEVGKLVLETDRIVIWTAGLDARSLSGNSIQSGQGQSTQRGDRPLEFYMEGNIVFGQGDRVIYADRMYYNVNQRHGTILNAEMLTPVPQYDGLMRLKAEVLQQLNEQNFLAYNAAITSSRMGFPRYWIQSENIELQDRQSPQVDPFTGQMAVDLQTGEPLVDHQLLSTSRNIFGYIGGVPVFYWPTLATDLTDPVLYIDQFRLGNDSIFGTQVLTDWNVYQLLGIREPPRGTDWTVSGDYLSERGFAVGTNFDYLRDSIFGISGPAKGRFEFWGLNDNGRDVLGQDRRSIIPEATNRGRIFWQHRQQLDIGFQVTAEVGLISDRTFLEQYFEREWDQQKDQTTGVELKRLRDDMSLNLLADVRPNDFLTQTEWLPRLDHFILGRSVLFDRLTWYAHSHAGYARFRVADAPTEPTLAGQFQLLPWERNPTAAPFSQAERNGLRAGTRQELDLPFDLGPVRMVPYVLGDVTFWDEDLPTGSDVTRAYGQAGIRASMPIWKANPSVQNTLFNLNGLAHKIVLDGEFFWADANRDLTRFPLYDPLDDDAQEFFRRRFFFGGGVFAGLPGAPVAFDERFYAMRSGMQSWVTAPSAEIADDLMLARVGVRQRWQTKRGLPGQERIVDWIVLDAEGTFFPQADRDNNGADAGMINYDFRWHVGDRVTLLSDGYVDFFGQGLRTVSAGGLFSRPEVGNLYVGFRSVEGVITSNILNASLSYRMSEKWIATAGTSYDFAATGNIGQSFSFTRIGESFLVRFGFSADVTRGNVGAVMSIEPRFLPNNRLGQVGDVRIPPVGAYGLE